MRDAYRVVPVYFLFILKLTNTMGFLDDLGKAGLGFVGNVGTGLINNALSQHNAKQQQEWQEKMWHLQNEYNDPSAMANRMRIAGLNPFSMTGAQPAGSAGTGSMAQTIPIESPLSALATISQIENLNATTSRTETETERILKDMAVLDQQLKLGVLQYDEYERRVKLLFEEWDKRNPFTVEAENTLSQTLKNKADAKLAEQKTSESIVMQSLMGYEAQMLQKQINWFDRDHEAAIRHTQASIALMDAQTQNYVVNTENVDLLKQRVQFVNSCSDWLGFDISALPDASKTQVLSIYRKVLMREITPVNGMREIDTIISASGTKERAIMETQSGSGSLSVMWGAGSASGSGSHTFNSNK